MEAGVVVSKDGEAVHWHLPPDRSSAALPDSRTLWEVMWESRRDIRGFAHSHPGTGVPSPSHEDLTSFAAIEAGLGARLTWWIISRDSVIVLTWAGPGRLDYEASGLDTDPPWTAELRNASYREEDWVLAMADLEEEAGGFPGFTGVRRRKFVVTR